MIAEIEATHANAVAAGVAEIHATQQYTDQHHAGIAEIGPVLGTSHAAGVEEIKDADVHTAENEAAHTPTETDAARGSLPEDLAANATAADAAAAALAASVDALSMHG